MYQKRYLGIKPVQIVQPLDTGSNGIKRNEREPGQQAFDKECARWIRTVEVLAPCGRILMEGSPDEDSFMNDRSQASTAVVLDTNVFVGAGFNPRSASAKIVNAVRKGQLRMI